MRLIRHHTKRKPGHKLFRVEAQTPVLDSGRATPERDQEGYFPRPDEFREGFLSSILKLYNEKGLGSATSRINTPQSELVRVSESRENLVQPYSLGPTPGVSPGVSPLTEQTPGGSPTSATPSTSIRPKVKREKWYANQHSRSTSSISELIRGSSSMPASPVSGGEASSATSPVPPKPKHKPIGTGTRETLMGIPRENRGQRPEDQIKIHLADLNTRHTYLLKICKALMQYGAPTHRLEGMQNFPPLPLLK